MAHTSVTGCATDAHVVKMENNKDVLRFTSDYDGATAGSPLDTVHFATGTLTPRAAEALEAFLHGPACHLEFARLVIDNPERLLASSPGMVSAFAGLTGLAYLELLGAGQHSRELLRGLKAELVMVNLVMIPVEEDLDEEDEAWEETGRNPITLLSNFQGTLEGLIGEGTETLCVEELTYPQCYPNVKEVTLEGVDIPVTTHYVHAYPNLSNLRIRTDPEEFVELLEGGKREIGLRRQLNIVEQLEYGCWPSLNHCDSTLGTLYVLGLQCHVRDLRILADIEGPSGMLGSVLMDTRPTILTLHQFRLGMLSSSGFASLMRGPSVRQLKTLEITLILDEDSGKDIGIDAAFSAMISALKPLTISAFGIMIICNFPGPYPREAGVPVPRISLTAEEEFLNGLQLDELAERILHAVSSLQTVAVMMVAHRTRGPAAAALGAHSGTELRTYKLAKAHGLLPGSAPPTAGRTRFPDWSNFWPLPLIGVSYLAHIRYRRYSPRRLPTLTSMKLPEIYAFLAIIHAMEGAAGELKDEVMNDSDLELIEKVARRFKNDVFSNKSFMETVDRFLDDGRREYSRSRHMYNHAASGGLLGKLAWWHDHIWSHEETWYRASVIWVTKLKPQDLSLNDFDRCVTHLANTFEADDDFYYQDYALWAFIPFGVSIPFAMAARWGQRRALSRVINGLQRLLMWATLYPYNMQQYQHYANLRKLENKHAIAQRIRDVLGLDPLTRKMVP
ncbi:uncharacterized protein TRAVEDRAFT_42733 [Trametes versicolor FP-101664 SS1]|uniref:uncharacterized protein n=1 Tax=Trametes versicolor (strain FP-101664) TaxID=717944 RepID=UPI0004623D67|nr:uncharacterized protein TRAVEDRAFT_42733 [Trametes versicolor FP-101664 SS1]EIW65359.1 hypothetical protein TRAVEDRAFT_42733 [Trametes versicolor FP-101664 SS1]